MKRTFEGIDGGHVEEERVHWLAWILGAALVAAVGVILVNRSSADPYEAALAEDNELRNQLYQATQLPTPDEVRKVLANHPPNMMYIPPGKFVSGRLRHEPTDMGGKRAEIEELDGFLIDVFEYPNLQKAPPKFGVSWKEADRLCTDQGKRLCTADEMEKACRGPENYVYSYGDTYDVDFCGKGVEDIHTSGQFPECKSTWGLYDISGNFREWTSSIHGESRRLVKGGLPGSARRGSRCAYSDDLSPYFADDTISFRCCRDPDAGEWSEPKKEDMAQKKEVDPDAPPAPATPEGATP